MFLPAWYNVTKTLKEWFKKNPGPRRASRAAYAGLTTGGETARGANVRATPAAGGVIPLSPSAIKISVRPAADLTAPGDFLLYGLNASGYVPVRNAFGRRAHLVILVARLTNLGAHTLRLGPPFLTFNLGAGAKKFEPAATRVTLERLSLSDGRAPAAALERLAADLRDRLTGGNTVPPPSFTLEPRDSVLIYSAFLPEGLAGLPVFAGDTLTFGVSFGVGAERLTYYGFRARPLKRLAAVFN